MLRPMESLQSPNSVKHVQELWRHDAAHPATDDLLYAWQVNGRLVLFQDFAAPCLHASSPACRLHCRSRRSHRAMPTPYVRCLEACQDAVRRKQLHRQLTRSPAVEKTAPIELCGTQVSAVIWRRPSSPPHTDVLQHESVRGQSGRRELRKWRALHSISCCAQHTHCRTTVEYRGETKTLVILL